MNTLEFEAVFCRHEKVLLDREAGCRFFGATVFCLAMGLAMLVCLQNYPAKLLFALWILQIAHVACCAWLLVRLGVQSVAHGGRLLWPFVKGKRRATESEHDPVCQ